MGFVHMNVRITHVANPEATEELEMLVDSGALYSIVPAEVLERLGIEPRETESFVLADGSPIERRVGVAYFAAAGRETASDVLFGEPGDSTLLGVVTLEGLGLVIDPAAGTLKPIQFRLGASVAA